jgi:subtilisin family serine protease
MAERKIMLQLRHNKRLAAQASTAADAVLNSAGVPRITAVSLDTSYAPVPLRELKPRPPSADPYDVGAAVEVSLAPEDATYIVRGEIDEKDIDEVRAHRDVVGVFSDPRIEPCITCGTTLPVGTDQDVENLLCVGKLRKCGMDGSGVLVAVVDNGINLAYLNGKGKTPNFKPEWSWHWLLGGPVADNGEWAPGNVPPHHGTMVAFNVCIAAPKCTLLDIVVMGGPPNYPGPVNLEGLLSTAIKAYAHLLDIMIGPQRIGEFRSMVVNNSWGMFHPSQDLPPEDPGNYSDNPNHPFNVSVATLAAAGADIIFAAGNCGPDCPDWRCYGITSNAIYGANGHPQALSVAGVDTTKERVGYSSIGPGRLTHQKPDISGYTHFAGSGVFTADGGTSTAAPVVAGVVAALRSKRPFNPADPTTSPAAMRNLVTSTAEDLGASGYDFMHGHGVVDGCALAEKFACGLWVDICNRYPWVCNLVRWPEFPVRWPEIQWLDIADMPFRIPQVIRFGRRTPLPPGQEGEVIEAFIGEVARRSGVEDAVQLGYVLRMIQEQMVRMGSPDTSKSGTV